MSNSAKKAYDDLVRSLTRKDKATGNDQIIKKQRCLNILGKDIACVQDSGSVSIPPAFLLLGVLVLLTMRK